MKIKNSKRGFTLVELIVSATMTVLLVGATCAAMILGLRVFNATAVTAQQQKDIRLAETALKDSLATARSYTFTTSKTGDIQLFFTGDTLTMNMNGTALTLNTINTVSVNFEYRSTGVCYATYEIATDGVNKTGAVVLNNVSATTDSTTTYTLNSAQTNTLNLDMP